jgi:hypothetical protein
MEPMQPTRFDPPVDGAWMQAMLDELCPGHHTVLSSSELADRPVAATARRKNIGSAPCLNAIPELTTHIDVNSAPANAAPHATRLFPGEKGL